MEAGEALAREPNGVAARARHWFEAFATIDYSQPIAFALLGFVFITARIPWLDLGYGTDPDAWRVALTAEYLWQTGDYYPSRLPGYPLHEFATAGFIKGGWVWTNMSTVLISLAGVFLFALIARKLELPYRGLLTLAFAFTPLLWINSVITMDYMWALTFILAAYLGLIYRSPTLAGIALGIAAGFRLTALGMIVPFWLLMWRDGQRGDLRNFTTTAAATTFLAYTPVIMVYGFSMFNFYDQAVPFTEFIKRLAKDGLGILGAIAVLVALAVSLPRLRSLPEDLRRDPHVLVWLSVPVVYFLWYTRLPHEVAYLIPIFPFAYFLLSRYLTKPALAGALAVIVFAGFVDITSPNDALVGIDRETFSGATLGQGMLLSQMDTQDAQMDFAREVRQVSLENASPNNPRVVIMGFIYPEFVMLYKDELEITILEEDHSAISQLSDKGLAIDVENGVEYVWLLEYDGERCACGFKQFQEQGKRIFFTADAARSTYAVYGYRPGYFEAREMQLSREHPSLPAGTAPTDR